MRINTNKQTLTKEEKKEAIDVTLGRLRGIMKNSRDKRGLELVNKVIKYIDEIKPIRI